MGLREQEWRQQDERIAATETRRPVCVAPSAAATSTLAVDSKRLTLVLLLSHFGCFGWDGRMDEVEGSTLFKKRVLPASRAI